MGSNPTLSATSVKARHIRHDEPEPFGARFDPERQDVRLLTGADHGLGTSVMLGTIAPGQGPRRHRHPHAEIFALHEGRATFEIDGQRIEAEAGDVVIVPPNAWHTFTSSGSRPLRETAVHEHARPVTEWEDGSRHG